ncbi:alpha/beta fold hydrolase [Streptacidiphilus sp. P02-A3a]|uniref:alpha/beta fold hydrolase n=1 Tax=Streptacidiphilus sp. P02-A3a TaxID=2704468 RepID=UPI0015F98AD4|nr:alpha/beta hydrolase [Streptacidiphilus sp. P02-A3a]QMU68721.1 alpha/beta hydrolase [Streptacidiphilus sp. P02-A3a]
MPVATSRSTFTVTGHDGAALAVYADGPDDAPVTLVLAHGWTLDATAWQHQAEDLTRSRAAADGAEPTGAVRVVRYDQRGHGRSEGGGSRWSIDLLGQDLAAVIEQTAPNGPVVLGGHSMGGMTVMALAAARPDLIADRVAGVLLTSTSAGQLDPRGRPEAPLRLRIQGHAQSAFFGYCARTAERSERIRAHLPGPERGVNPFLVKRYLYGPQAPRPAVLAGARMIHDCPMAAVAGWYPALMLHDKAGALEALRELPVEVVVGSGDRLTPVAHSRRLLAELPRAALHIEPDCGHMLLLERPEVVSSRLRKLCRIAVQGSN